jgi:mitochondrial fission protein ELM1
VSDEEVVDRGQTLAAAGATSVLECGLGALDAPAEALRERSGLAITRYDPATGPFSKRPAEGFDAVAWTGGLEVVPDADLAWLIDGLFQFARQVVHVTIRDDAEHPEGARVGRRRDRFFWSQRFEAAAARHPEVDWRIVGTRGRDDQRRVVWIRGRGRLPGRNPLVWVLLDHKPGHTTQSLGLADALGWPYEVRRIGVNPLNRISNRLLGATRIGVGLDRSDPLRPPWPDLVISTGRRQAPVARWIAKHGRGHPRVVLLGRKGADIVDGIDLAVTCSHFRLLPHPRRLETIAPINGISDSVLDAARSRWKQLRPGTAPGPIVLLAGGSSAHHQLTPAAARQLGRDVVALAAGREVLAITSPRTGADAAAALAEGLGDRGQLCLFEDGGEENPYLGYLALADAIVATGESESMLGEAVAAGVPVYIYPLAKKPASFNQRFGEWVRRRAYARPLKRGKGSVRPQTGLEALCARALARGLVRIHRDLDEFHRSLVRCGVARMFGSPLETGPRRPLREVDAAVDRVRAMLSLPAMSRSSVEARAPALGGGSAPEVSPRVASASMRSGPETA